MDNDETLLWTGKPKQGIVFRSSDIFMIPFSLLWGGFAIFWETTVILTDAPFIMRLWGIPFVLVGLFMIFGRFFYDSASRKRTIYGITENRVIIKSGIFKKSIKSLNIKTLSDITLKEESNRSGSIIFGPENGFNGIFRGTGRLGSNGKMTPSFEMIKNVRKVYRQIIDLQTK